MTSSILELANRISRPPPHIVEAAVRALRDGHHGYTSGTRNSGAARRCGDRNCGPARGQRGPGPSCRRPRRQGDDVLCNCDVRGTGGLRSCIQIPGFPIYESVIDFTGAKAVPIPLLEERDFSFDAEVVLESITPATRLIILNTPANPTGGVVPKSEIDKLADGLASHPEVAVLSDEIYSPHHLR